jgi:hypothetical protein
VFASSDARRATEKPDGGTDGGITIAPGSTFKLTVFPKDAEVQIGSGTWVQLGTDGAIDVPVPSTPLKIAVRKESCCEGETRDIPIGQTTQLDITLPYLPAAITPECDVPDATVTIDGAGARMGRQNLVVFAAGSTLSQKDVVVEFKLGPDKFDRRPVTVAPRDNQKVSCAH